ncbi:hypothetical protein ERJ75_000238100 [Trypanosoma vivax]|nr:hypothetical protein ERJ75_000238100 [Trypanosoma vivax]
MLNNFSPTVRASLDECEQSSERSMAKSCPCILEDVSSCTQADADGIEKQLFSTTCKPASSSDQPSAEAPEAPPLTRQCFEGNDNAFVGLKSPAMGLRTPSPVSRIEEEQLCGSAVLARGHWRRRVFEEAQRRTDTSLLTISPVLSGSAVQMESDFPLSDDSVLEGELRAASVDDLVVMLMDLSRYNEEAACFIRERTQRLSLRSITTPVNHSQVRGVDFSEEPRSSSLQPVRRTPGAHRRESVSLVDHSGLSVHTTPYRPPQRSKDTEGKSDGDGVSATMWAEPRSETSVSSSRFALRSRIASQLTMPSCKQQFPHGASRDVCIAAEARLFSLEVHPCLLWHGKCHHGQNCMFQKLPRNVCLKWLRGTCAAGSQCSGVHRLPDDCSSKLLDFHEMSHGVAHESCIRRGSRVGRKLSYHPQPDDNRAKPAVGEDNISLKRSDGTSTPRDRTIRSPVSVPASLERLVRRVPLDRQYCSPAVGSTPMRSDGVCWGDLNFEEGITSENSAEWSNKEHVLLSPARCLSDAFAEAADFSAATQVADISIACVSSTSRRPSLAYTGDKAKREEPSGRETVPPESLGGREPSIDA